MSIDADNASRRFAHLTLAEAGHGPADDHRVLSNAWETGDRHRSRMMSDLPGSPNAMQERTDRCESLGLGGSLRDASENRALLYEATALVPADTELDLSQLAVIASLPPFSQDVMERDGLPAGVAELKDALRGADGLLIATPEYNWGISGFLKNAVDWASRPASDIPQVFGDLPVALIGADGGAGARVAQNAWLSVFRFLKMRPWFGQSLYVDRAHERFDEPARPPELMGAAVRHPGAHSFTKPDFAMGSPAFS